MPALAPPKEATLHGRAEKPGVASSSPYGTESFMYALNSNRSRRSVFLEQFDHHGIGCLATLNGTDKAAERMRFRGSSALYIWREGSPRLWASGAPCLFRSERPPCRCPARAQRIEGGQCPNGLANPGGRLSQQTAVVRADAAWKAATARAWRIVETWRAPSFGQGGADQ